MPELFEPRAGTWRTLEVEVGPEAVRAWWGEERQEVGALTAPLVARFVAEAQSWSGQPARGRGGDGHRATAVPARRPGAAGLQWLRLLPERVR
jgi:hypothetical protein